MGLSSIHSNCQIRKNVPLCADPSILLTGQRWVVNPVQNESIAPRLTIDSGQIRMSKLDTSCSVLSSIHPHQQIEQNVRIPAERSVPATG